MPRSPLPSGADVVIVGGGVVGVSAAFHLAEAGAEVVLLERDQLASGSTSKAAGGLRAQFSDALNIEIAKRSLQAYKRFEQRPGWEIDYEEIGYLFVLTTETRGRGVQAQRRAAERARRAVADHHARGGAGDLPAARGRGHPGRQLLPDRRARHARVGRAGLRRSARAQHGAHLAVSTPVEGIDVVDGVIKGVRTPHGTVATGTVISAAGAWSRACGEMAGVRLDVTPLRRQVLFTAPMADLPDKLPLTIDFATGFYFHREGRGLLMGMADPNETPGFLTGDDRRLDPRRCWRSPSGARRASPPRRSRAAGPASTT